MARTAFREFMRVCAPAGGLAKSEEIEKDQSGEKYGAR
jgi:hypothetical protein